MAASGETQAQNVFIVRHGERLDNVDAYWSSKVAWGRERPYDPPLTDIGKCQAAAVGERLKQENVHCVISSPFFRCLQTAQEIANAVLARPAVGIHNRLCEFLHPSCGIRVAPAVPAGDLSSHGIKVDSSLGIKSNLPTFPENFERSCDRHIQSVVDLADKYWPHTIVLVTHGYAVTETFRWMCPDEGDAIWGANYCAWVKVSRSTKRGQFTFGESHGLRS